MAYMKKEKVLSRIRKLCEVRSEPPMSRDDMVELKLLQKLEKEFSETPTADVEEVKHGHWIDLNITEWQCSECKYRVERWNNTPHCPDCGTKMDGGIKYD